MEGNTNRSTVGKPEDFMDWGKRWGTNETEAQLTLQNQWDNILRHVMGITASMEVWSPHAPSASSSSSCAGENFPAEKEAPNQQITEEHPGTAEEPGSNRRREPEHPKTENAENHIDE